MKTAIFFVALVSCWAVSEQSGTGRRLFQEASDDCPTVFDVAEQNGLTTLVEALMLDELDAFLDNNTVYPLTYTVFAPTNDAFDATLEELGVGLEDLRDSGELDDILQYHFAISPYTSAQLQANGRVGTNFRNQTLDISGNTITAFGSNATIVTPDVQACKTIIHVIDGLLIPDFNAVAPPTGAPGASSTAST